MQAQAVDAQVEAEAPEDASQPQQEQEVQPQPQQSEWSQKLSSAQENFYDEAAWNALLDFAEDSDDLEKIGRHTRPYSRDTQTLFVYLFPYSSIYFLRDPEPSSETVFSRPPEKSSAQISYLNHFLVNQATFPYAEALFARFLRTSVSVDLWKFYIIYVRSVMSVGFVAIVEC